MDSDFDLEEAHRACSQHRRAIFESEQCGCFYCLRTYSPTAIVEWTDEDESGLGQTALCPHCGIDAVVGSASSFPVTPQFLQAMHQRWFAVAT